MKKVALTLASVMAAAAFAPEASAIPSFARQTGMACSACHQQHYPVLNGFGQAFKAAGYTMMGAQEKVEGEHLSIPAVLNGSMLLKARYQQSDTKGVTDAVSGDTPQSGQWQIPDEFSLFLGGRVADAGALKVGFMFEGNTAASPLVAGFKMPVVFDLDSVKLLAIPYLTDALGASYGFEQSSTGAVRGVRWAEHRKDISAQQYLNTDGAATGVAFVAVHEMGYINVSRYAPSFTAANDKAQTLTATYVRVAATPTIAGWAINTGVQSWSGSIVAGGADNNAAELKPNATAVDFQAFGEVAGMETGLYATWGNTAKDSSSTAGFNADRNAMTVGADFSLIPHTLHLGAAYRTATRNASTTALKDNSITAMAIYDLTQNIALHVNHSMRSGDVADAGSTEKTLTTFLLEAAW